MKLVAFLLLPLALFAQSPDSVEAEITTEMGVFRFEFLPDKAPKHVEQFVKLAKQGYYNGSAFHFAVKYGAVGGGDPVLKNPKAPRALWGTGGFNTAPTEISSVNHVRGVVTGIRNPDKWDSDGSQFVICLSTQRMMDRVYSPFGRVTEGIEVLDKISQSPVDEKNFTQTPVRIQKIAIVPKRPEPYVNATIDDLRKTVLLRTTLGDMKLKMEPDWAPENVRNFLRLASSGWYNHTGFFRLDKDYVLQGGTSESRAGGPGHYADRWVKPVKGEFRNDVKHVKGTVSMARDDDPDSALTSFVLLLGTGESMDGRYSAFARVVEGLDVLDTFNKEEVDGNRPKRRLEIIEITVE